MKLSNWIAKQEHKATSIKDNQRKELTENYTALKPILLIYTSSI